MTVAVRGDSKEAAGAAEAALGGVLNGVAYPCSPGARSYCDGEVELDHEMEVEAEVGAVGGATHQVVPKCQTHCKFCMLLAFSLRASLRPSLSSALLFARVAQSSRQNICTMSDEVAKAQQSVGPTVRPLIASSPIAPHRSTTPAPRTTLQHATVPTNPCR